MQHVRNVTVNIRMEIILLHTHITQRIRPEAIA